MFISYVHFFFENIGVPIILKMARGTLKITLYGICHSTAPLIGTKVP